MFEHSLLKEGKMKGSALILSLLLQVGALGLALVIPMVFFDIVPIKELRSTTIFLPPPPSPPPPPPPVHAKVPIRKTPAKPFVFRVPSEIPKDIPVIKDLENKEHEQQEYSGPRVPGGIPCGTSNTPPCPKAFGTGNGTDSGNIVAAPPPSPPQSTEPPKPKVEQVKLGGHVIAANLIKQVKPTYPTLARQARIQGTVRFAAIIGKDGMIQNLQLVSGPPLLVQAALDAVREWRYRPTLLNGEAVEVITQIDVNFTLTI